MNDQLLNIIHQFSIEGIVASIKPFGSGHINDTYKVVTSESDYLLQRVNHEIFKNVEGLMHNLVAVTDFLHKKLNHAGATMQIPMSIQAKNGKFYTRDGEGNWWRVFEFVKDSVSFDQVTSNDLAYEGGRSYGWFVKALEDFPHDTLIDTIPRFHDAQFRIGNFKRAVQMDIAGRVGGAKELVAELIHRADSMMLIYELGRSGRIPMRVTHNDTKINNVLFNRHNKGICIIDLDTVMTGYVHFDFGDAIRTFTNMASEDEIEPEKVFMNIDYFKAFADGFLSQTHDILTKEEIETLAYSARYITYEQTIRFFTDYLEGDKYYKINSQDHNLIRTRAQFWLLQSIEANFSAMEKVFIQAISSK